MKISKMFFVAIVLISLSFFCRTALAEVKAGSFTLTPHAGAYVFDSEQSIQNAPAYGLGLGYNYNKNFGVEGAFNFVYTDTDPSDTNVRAYLYRIDGLYHFLPERKLVPYLAAGIGAITLDTRNGNDTNGMFNYGGGFKFAISDILDFRGDIRHIMDFEDSNNNFLLTAGFTYAFGMKEEAPRVVSPAPSPTPAPAPVPTPVGGRDGDGVTDDIDKCPDTPAGVPVDSEGCPLDSDGDGVYDYQDKCPDTPRGIKVDDKGCPLPIKEKVSITLNVQFDFDSAVIKDEYKEDIKKVAGFLSSYPELNAVIEGHTCNIGTEEYNMGLSRRRAESVMKHIIGTGINPARLKAIGYGESRPIADNKTKEGRERNRRVEAEISTVVIKMQ